MISMALTTDEAIVAYLKSRNIPFAKIEALSGGYANYVWRLTEHSDSGLSLPAIKVLKHAEPFLKSFRLTSFTAERMDFEAKALTLVSNSCSMLPKSLLVDAAKLFWYDEEAHVMCMSDGGTRNLKTAYSDPEIDVLSAGRRLGGWLAAFHAMGARKGESERGTWEGFDNILAKTMSRHSYSNLASTVEKSGLGEKKMQLARQIDEEFGGLLQTDDECVCHGDFWPGNILVGDSEQLPLTIVDWEMIRRGCSATDVAQFAGEAWLLDKFQGSRGLCKAFLKSYAESSHGPGNKGGNVAEAQRWSRRFAIHFATHLAYWPAYVPWASAEETRKFAEWALDLAQSAMSGDLDEIRSEAIGGEFNPLSCLHSGEPPGHR